MIGLEEIGMNLEDVFISVVEQTEQARTAERTRYVRNTAKKRRVQTRESLTESLAEDLVKNAEQQRALAAEEDEEL